MSSKLIKPFFLASLMAIFSVPADAQYLWDVGVHVGAANYLGEMGGVEKTRRDFVWDMKLGQTRWAFGVFGRRKISRLISVNMGLMYLRVQGADALSTNRPRVGRNLNFRNTFPELYLRPEVTIYQDNDLGGRGRYKTDFRLFGYVGIAGFYHSPQGQINRLDKYYNLWEYDLEGEDYDQLALAVPVGMGFHFTMKRRHRIGFDFGWRTTFTDYLDDVSTVYVNPEIFNGDPTAIALWDQSSYALALDPNLPGKEQYGYWESNGTSPASNNKRGDPTHNDSYMTMTLTYSYVLRGQSNFYRQRYSWVRGKKRIGRKSRAKF